MRGDFFYAMMEVEEKSGETERSANEICVTLWLRVFPSYAKAPAGGDGSNFEKEK